MNLPNKLTLGRIIAVPFFIASYLIGFNHHFYIALIIFILASITDFLDGQIARKRNLITNFGKIMDPLADKVLVYSAFCLFVADGAMPAWMLIVILAREFLVAGVRMVAASEGKVIAADMSGKIKTVLQMIAIPLILIFKGLTVNGFVPGVKEAPGAAFFNIASQLFLWAALLMTVYSGIEYIVKNKDIFNE